MEICEKCKEQVRKAMRHWNECTPLTNISKQQRQQMFKDELGL